MKPAWVMLAVALPAAAAPADPPAVPEARTVFEAPAPATPRTRIDGFIEAAHTKERLTPAAPCGDAVFIRRVFLDLTGTLPTADEVRTFLADRAADKRARLIEALFAREEFTDYWTMRWCDLLRVKAEFPINLWPNPAQAYHRLIRDCVRRNLPLDRFARGLLTATGSNMRVPESNFFRAVQSREPAGLAGAASLSFMGVRPESWSAGQLAALAACFSRVGFKSTSEWKEEILFVDFTKPAPPAPITMPDGVAVSFAADGDPRVAFADWLLRRENPWFARHFANRAWFWLFGRGLVHPPDDFRPDNPPSHPQLLDFLAGEFLAKGCDFRHLLRLICNSRTYQQSPVPAANHPRNEILFANYPVRRLDAEVLIDALCAVTGTSESYSSPIPEPFTFLPDGTRAIAIPDGSISSSFLELFGRPPRDSGLAAERNAAPTAGQRLHFLNSSHVRRKLENSALLRDLQRDPRDPGQALNRLYLTVLSRHPTPGEREIFRATLASSNNRRNAMIDLVWALLNTAEFQCRH
jgi:hypothetical protein